MCYWAYLVIHKVSYFNLRSFTEDLGSSAVPFVLLPVQVKSESHKTHLWPRVFLKHLLKWLHPITFLHEGWDPKQGFDKENISAGTVSSTEFSLLSSLYFFCISPATCRRSAAISLPFCFVLLDAFLPEGKIICPL